MTFMQFCGSGFDVCRVFLCVDICSFVEVISGFESLNFVSMKLVSA